MKNFIKSNLKVLITIIITTIIVGSVTVYAANQYLARDISFTPINENFKKNNGDPIENVEDAINALYQKSKADFITDGLVFGFDPIINYNLGANVTLINNMAYFNGNNSYINFSRYQNKYITYEVDFISENITSDIKLISSTEAGGCQINTSNSNLSFLIDINGEYKTLSTPIELNKEYHAVGTYDGTTIKLYINGELVQSLAVSGEMTLNVNNTITMIGAEPSANTPSANFFKGYIKSARVYNRALTENEIKINYNYEKSK